MSRRCIDYPCILHLLLFASLYDSDHFPSSAQLIWALSLRELLVIIWFCYVAIYELLLVAEVLLSHLFPPHHFICILSDIVHVILTASGVESRVPTSIGGVVSRYQLPLVAITWNFGFDIRCHLRLFKCWFCPLNEVAIVTSWLVVSISQGNVPIKSHVDSALRSRVFLPVFHSLTSSDVSTKGLLGLHWWRLQH